MQLSNLFLRYNLRNTVNAVTRVTKIHITMLDIITINKKNYIEATIVMDLGLGAHYAHVIHTI
jgi:hypothetical protein